MKFADPWSTSMWSESCNNSNLKSLGLKSRHSKYLGCRYNDYLTLTRMALTEDVSVMTTWHKQKMHLFWYSWNVDIMILLIRWAGLQTNSSTWSFTLSQCKVSVSPAGWLFRSQPCSDVCVFFSFCHLCYREWEPYARCVLQWNQHPWVRSTDRKSVV